VKRWRRTEMGERPRVMIPCLTRISRRVHGRVAFLQRPIRRVSWPRVRGAKGWIVAGKHPRPPLNCQLFPDG